MTSNDIMLRLALIAALYSRPDDIHLRVAPLIKLVPRSRRTGLYMIMESKNPQALIHRALEFYEVEPNG